jgi:hypothetical protein
MRRDDQPPNDPAKIVLLTWHHTEFGRRSTCEQYRIVRTGAGWQLLDAQWEPLAKPVATIPAAQRQAERCAARAAAHDEAPLQEVTRC